MRILAFLLVSLAARLLALDNGVTVYNASGSPQTNLPVTASRVFGRGEVPATYACAQPYIDGVAAAVWQCDKKSAWDDGSLKWALFGAVVPSVGAGSSVHIDFRPSASTSSGSGLTKAATLALTWEADMQFTYNTGAAEQFANTVDARTLMNALSESACSLRKWRDGPVVTEWVVEDRCTSLSHDFGAKWDSVTSKWITAPDASYKSIHPYFIVSAFAGGAVKVQFIVEDPWTRKAQGQVYQQRFRAGVVLTDPTALVEQQTTDYLHIFGSRYKFDGWASAATVGDYFIDFNLPYLIQTGQVPAYATEVQVANQTQATMSANHIQGYIDFMTAALSTYGGLPEKPQYCRTSTTLCRAGTRCCGIWTKDTNIGGAWDDIGVIPGFYMTWLYAAGYSSATIAQRNQFWKEVFLGNALAANNQPLHIRESRSAATYCGNSGKYANCTTASLRTISEFGRPVSLDAHDNETTEAGLYYPDSTGGSYNVPTAIVAGCTVGQPCHQRCQLYGTCNGTNSWQAIGDSNGTLHIYGLHFLPALFTGDLFYLEALMLHTGFWSMQGSQVNSNTILNRRGSMGLRGNKAEIRDAAWLLRNYIQAAFMSPSDWPEGEHFTKLIQNNVAHLEGQIGLTTAEGANFYSTDPASPYYFGYNVSRVKSPITTSQNRPNPANPLKLINLPSSAVSLGTVLPTNTAVATDRIYSGAKPWMDSYWAASMDLGYKMGFTFIGSVLKYASTPALFNWAMNPFNTHAYILPLSAGNKRTVVTSMAQVSGLVYRVTAPGHGLTGSNVVLLCCADPTWPNGWYGVERRYGEGADKYQPITNVTADTFDITLAAAPTSGSYPSCCTTSANYTLAVNSVDSYLYEAGYLTSLAEFTPLMHPQRRISTGFSTTDPYWYSWIIATNNSYFKAHTQLYATLLDQGIRSFNGVSVEDAYGWMLRNGYGLTREFGDGWFECPPGYSAQAKFRAFSCSHPVGAYRVKPKVDNVTVTPGQTQVHFRFTAPTGDGAKVALMAAPNGDEVFTDSRDSGDGAATCVGRDCSFAASSLTAGTRYRYRITGGALGGTARVEGFVTTTASGGTTSYSMKFTPPAGLGIADVVVEHGATSSYGTTEAAASCSTGCTVTLAGLPANAVRYLRWSYRTGALAQVAQGTDNVLVK